MNYFKLNDNIGFYRKKNGLTQEDLAKALGVTNQSVSKWESAQCCPDITLIPQIAKIFEISIDELFGQVSKTDAICTGFPLHDDEVFRVFVAQGKQILTAEDMNDLNNDKVIDIQFPKNCNETTRQYFKVEVFGNVFCDASINGDVISHGKIECNEINGAVQECRDSINCKGSINGCASAGNNISCGGTINGGVHSGNNISCGGLINGGVNCENNVSCGGDIKGNVDCRGSVACKVIEGDVQCGGSVECKTIEGDVQCEGDIIYKQSI